MGTSITGFFLIQQINRLVVKRVNAILKTEDLTAGQYLLLHLLSNLEPCSSAELARHANMTAQSMGELISTLEQRKLVERSADNKNAKIILINRTEQGKEIFSRCKKLVKEAEDEFFSPIKSIDQARIRGSLALIREIELSRNP